MNRAGFLGLALLCSTIGCRGPQEVTLPPFEEALADGGSVGRDAGLGDPEPGDGEPGDGGPGDGGLSDTEDGGPDAPNDAGTDDAGPNAAERRARRNAAIARIGAQLTASSLFDVTVMLARPGEEPIVFTKGAGDPDREYAADSAQKLVVASVLLREAQAAGLTPDSPLSAFPFPRNAAGDRASITLGEMLSFTSGFESPPICTSLAGSNFHTCVQRLLDSELTIPKRFYYGTHHMMIAARALVDDTETYATLFDRFTSDTGLFQNSSSTSAEMPLAFRTTPRDYMAFLNAFALNEVVDATTRAQMLSDQVGDLELASSPAAATGEEWTYGFGNWVRCDDGCDTQHHSAGSRGFYPWIDVEDDSYGVIAFNGSAGDWDLSDAFFRSIRADVQVLMDDS